VDLAGTPLLERRFEYEAVELSNNLAENSMRPIALGRKNWLHVGSVKTVPKVAAILSLWNPAAGWMLPGRAVDILGLGLPRVRYGVLRDHSC
jgi:hypothetical protein